MVEKMPFQLAGFFRELGHGDPEGPSLVEARGRVPPEERERLASYLRRGADLAATGQVCSDYFETSTLLPEALAIRTDGVWAWPSDLAYYVEKHGAEVPAALVDHIKAVGYSPVSLSEEELVDLSNRLID